MNDDGSTRELKQTDDLAFRNVKTQHYIFGSVLFESFQGFRLAIDCVVAQGRGASEARPLMPPRRRLAGLRWPYLTRQPYGPAVSRSPTSG